MRWFDRHPDWMVRAERRAPEARPISAVLKGLGEDWIRGYLPAFNIPRGRSIVSCSRRLCSALL